MVKRFWWDQAKQKLESRGLAVGIMEDGDDVVLTIRATHFSGLED